MEKYKFLWFPDVCTQYIIQTLQTISIIWSIRIRRQYNHLFKSTAWSSQPGNHHAATTKTWCYVSHMLTLWSGLQTTALQENMLSLCWLSCYTLHSSQNCHHRRLRRLVDLFRCLRGDDLLFLEAELEEGEHWVQHVVLAFGGGHIVSFIWENLGSRKEKECH